ncbi:MAG: TRL-like family protein [Nitrosomonas sp.]|nr:TRL-like family protein [Nitrosomonas sp.]
MNVLLSKMNKMLSALVSICLIVILTGCATSFPVGSLYTEIALPVNATSAGAKSPKVGTASCTSILTLLATGDCSIEAAKKNGNISTVSHVDWDAKNILGIYGEYKITVYGN